MRGLATLERPILFDHFPLSLHASERTDGLSEKGLDAFIG